MNFRGTLTAVHGLLFGTFFLLAVYALFTELLQLRYRSPGDGAVGVSKGKRVYLILTAACGWAAVLSGTYIIYPWYRAVPPHGADLQDYPKALLLSQPRTAALHTIGMEWKEHIAFLAPIAFTMLAYVVCRYGGDLVRVPQLRRTLLAFSASALLATGAAGAVGAFLNKAAPTENSQPSQHVAISK